MANMKDTEGLVEWHWLASGLAHTLEDVGAGSLLVHKHTHERMTSGDTALLSFVRWCEAFFLTFVPQRCRQAPIGGRVGDNCN